MGESLMLERTILAIGLILLGLGAYLAVTRLQLRRAGRAAAGAPGLETLEPGKPAILYFTAPGCVPCRTVQVPALEKLQAELADGLQVIKLDATRRLDAANFWGVLSVPTTFVLDRRGRARRVNHGVAGADKLRGQLQDIGEVPVAQASRVTARAKVKSVEG